MFADAFTDRYSRDGLVGVRVPHLNTLVWRYALEDAGDGAMIWRDADGQMVAFNMVHQSGVEGWMGPLAVRPDRQGEGLGSTMVRLGIEWLKAQGATTIGLETMPRTVENIGFYSRIGLRARAAHRHPGARRAAPGARCARAALRRRRPARTSGSRSAARLTDALAPGVDFTREIALTRDLGIGDTTLVRDGGSSSVSRSGIRRRSRPGGAKDEVRVLKLAAAIAVRVRAPARGAARRRPRRNGVGRIAIRCQTEYADAYLRSSRPATGCTGPTCG